MSSDERERRRELYRLQALLCQVLADPTRIELIELLGDGPKAVKELAQATGQRQAKISQHLAILRQRGLVHAQRVGTEMHYSLTDPRILEACHLTRALLLDQLLRQGELAESVLMERR